MDNVRGTGNEQEQKRQSDLKQSDLKQSDLKKDARLNELFLAYRDACVVPGASPNFMPGLWARVEARENSRNIFGRMARALVTAALAASVVLGLLVSFEEANQPLTGTYIEAL